MNKLKFCVRKALGLPVYYYFKRDRIPASTHLPVLLGISRLFRIERVLEFGAGKFSTLTFLNRDIFPHVQSVRSFETSEEWKLRIESLAEGDPRLAIELIDENVPGIAARCDYGKYDLVFVDNGPNRAETIKEVVAHEAAWNLVMVHDYENPPYAQAAVSARHKFCFDGYCPHTGVLWNDKLGRNVRGKLRRLNRGIKRHVTRTESGDTVYWTRIVRELVPDPA